MHSLRAAVLSFTLLGGMPTTGNDRDIPGWMTGHFTDDYGIVHVITDSTWQLGAHDRYWLIETNESAAYLLARNDSTNVENPGKWTRIDWVRLPDMAPWEWAFCLIEYRAETRAMAQAVQTADPAHPRDGCNGFPFSRMRRTHPDSAAPRPY
jgi:hypothetical protein